MEKLLIHNGLTVDPASKTEKVQDILLAGGVIARMGENLNDGDAKVIDASGLAVLPGLIDMHVHFRDPGQTHKEDIFTGAMAAAAGGVTAVCCMPNTSPTVDSPEAVAYILEKAAKACGTRIFPVASVTKGLQGAELTDFAALKKAGAIAVSDDGRPVENAAMFQRALEKAAPLHMPVISHCEDLHIIDGGIINKGAVAEKLGVRGMDRSSEDSVTAREIAIAAATGTAVHIAHVSTRGSAALVRDAKARGVKVTAETCPHYFILTEKELLRRDANFRMNPPLREEDDRLAILEAVLDGTIDCIVTDHAPHAASEKADFEKAPNGVVGLETSLAATLTAPYHTGKASLSDIAALMSLHPARILGLPFGTLQNGAPADITLVDVNREWTVAPEKLCSKSHNTPFAGKTFKGRAVATIAGESSHLL